MWTPVSNKMRGKCYHLWTLCLMALPLTCQTCTTVYETGVKCASDGDVILSCPVNYEVFVRDTTPMRVKGPGCHQNISTACTIEPLGSYVRNFLCKGMQECVVPVTLWGSLGTATCGTSFGPLVLFYRYTCRPGSNILLPDSSICSIDKSTGSFMSIKSSPSTDQYAIDSPRQLISSDCACGVEVPADTEVTITRTSFSKSTFNCNQRVVIETREGDVIWYMCPTHGTTVTIPCKDTDQKYFFRYETTDNTVAVSFTLQIAVSHNSYVDLKCGLKYPYKAEPTLPPTTPTPTSTTTQPIEYSGTEPASSTPADSSSAAPSATTSDTNSPKEPKVQLFSSDEMLIVYIGTGTTLLLVMLFIIVLVCAVPKKRKDPTEKNNGEVRASFYAEHFYEEPTYATPYEEPISRVPPPLNNMDPPVFHTRPHYIPSFIEKDGDVAQNPIYGRSHDLFFAY